MTGSASTTSGTISRTKLLRETGNLKLVQRALNHADLKTTTRYAHVLDDEVAEALERVAELGINPGSRCARWAKMLQSNTNPHRASLPGGLGVPSSNLGAPTK